MLRCPLLKKAFHHFIARCRHWSIFRGTTGDLSWPTFVPPHADWETLDSSARMQWCRVEKNCKESSNDSETGGLKKSNLEKQTFFLFESLKFCQRTHFYTLAWQTNRSLLSWFVWIGRACSVLKLNLVAAAKIASDCKRQTRWWRHRPCRSPAVLFINTLLQPAISWANTDIRSAWKCFCRLTFIHLNLTWEKPSCLWQVACAWPGPERSGTASLFHPLASPRQQPAAGSQARALPRARGKPAGGGSKWEEHEVV